MVEFPDKIGVGTYTSREEAERAVQQLATSGIEDAEVVQPSDPVWQVRVPVADRDRAIAELNKHEQWIMDSH